MDEDMLEQIQQMITRATESLRQDFRQDMAAVESRLGGRFERMASDFGERIEGVEQSQRSMESRLGERIERIASDFGERIDESKRHSGVLVEGLRHELQLVAEGLQMHVDQRHNEERAHMDHKFQDMQALINTRIDNLDQRVRTLEQR